MALGVGIVDPEVAALDSVPLAEMAVVVADVESKAAVVDVV